MFLSTLNVIIIGLSFWLNSTYDDNNTVNRLIVIINRLPQWVCRRLRVWNLEMMTFFWQENFFCNSVLCVPVLSSEPRTKFFLKITRVVLGTLQELSVFSKICNQTYSTKT